MNAQEKVRDLFRLLLLQLLLLSICIFHCTSRQALSPGYKQTKLPWSLICIYLYDCSYQDKYFYIYFEIFYSFIYYFQLIVIFLFVNRVYFWKCENIQEAMSNIF